MFYNNLSWKGMRKLRSQFHRMHNLVSATPSLATDLVHRAIRMLSVSRALISLSFLDRVGTVYGSRKLKKGTPQYDFTLEIAFWLGLFGFSMRSGGATGIMAAANEGCLVAKQFIDMLEKQRDELFHDWNDNQLKQIIKKTFNWKYTDEIFALSAKGDLPSISAVVYHLIFEGKRPLSIGVTATFFRETEIEPLNRFVETELAQQEFFDRQEVLFVDSDFHIFLEGRLGTHTEWLNLIEALKHLRAIVTRKGREIPPVYLVDESGHTWAEKIDSLSDEDGIIHVGEEDFSFCQIRRFDQTADMIRDILVRLCRRRGKNVFPGTWNREVIESARHEETLR
jgi:predicted Rossmann-fold nucleotide-binding protein